MEEKLKIKEHFECTAEKYDFWKKKNHYYYSLIKRFYQKNIPAGSSVLEFGCATGDILSSCNPKRGLGIDISGNMIRLARGKHPDYEFRVGDAEEFFTEEKFDYVIMSDLIDHLTNTPRALENACAILNPKGKVIINSINPLWNPLFGILEKLKLKMPEGPHYFLPNRIIEFFCRMKGFKIVAKEGLVFIPIKIPLLSEFLNAVFPKVPILKRFCWVQILIAEKDDAKKRDLSYSLIIPAHNEENNIEECVRRVPRSGKDCEIIVVDDGSRDNTLAVAEKLQKEIPVLKIVKLPGNQGKSCAVEKGIEASTKEAIIILDADMSVAPEDVPLFIEPMERGLVRFVNGTRFAYNMEMGAMTNVKKIGNFVFASVLSLIVKSHLSDCLCGTKAFFRKDFSGLKLSEERWGDFVLLWEARRKNLRIGEVPIRYYSRKSGESKMKVFADGFLFLRYILKISAKSLRGKY